jgi:hypothetical protein
MSTGSISNSHSESWPLGEMQDRGDCQAQGGMTRGSNESELSHETGRPSGEFIGQVNPSAVANGGAYDEEEERPPAKRQRKMMIRYFDSLKTSCQLNIVSLHFLGDLLHLNK